MDDWWNSWWAKAVAYALLAAFGGFMGYVMRTFEKGAAIRWGRGFFEGFAAGFVGLLVMLTCNALGLSEQWTGVIVGVSGWMGANASIRVLEKIMYEKLGLERRAKPRDPKPEDEDNA